MQVPRRSVDVEWFTLTLETLDISRTSQLGCPKGLTPTQRPLFIVCSRKPHEQLILNKLTGKYVDKCLRWITEGFDGVNYRTKPVQVIHQTGLNMVKQLCALLDANFIEEHETLFYDTKATCSLNLESL